MEKTTIIKRKMAEKTHRENTVMDSTEFMLSEAEVLPSTSSGSSSPQVFPDYSELFKYFLFLSMNNLISYLFQVNQSHSGA